jgi:hypothetical protein
MHLLVIERGHVDTAHVAIDTDHRRQAGGKVQVGRIVLDAESQQISDIHETP